MDIQSEKSKEYYEARARAELTQSAAAGNSNTAGLAQREQTSRELLEQAIRHFEHELMGLRELVDALPRKLPREADLALVKMIQRAGYTK